jgi:hypothetical protein
MAANLKSGIFQKYLYIEAFPKPTGFWESLNFYKKCYAEQLYYKFPGAK